jgi:zinc transporter ZupT
MVAHIIVLLPAAATIVFLALAVFFVRAIRVPPEERADFWQSVAWGRLFVALVYASLVIIALDGFLTHRRHL